jgi:hypothetical protein
MTRYVLVDAQGFCAGIVESESRTRPRVPPGGQVLSVTDGRHVQALRFLGSRAHLRSDGRWAVMPERQARRWDLSRGLSPEHAFEETELQAAHVEAVRASGMLADFSDALDELPALPLAARVFPIPAMTPLPGVEIREMTEVEAAQLEARVAASGLYPEPAQQLAARVQLWWEDPRCWPLAIAWQGTPLQFECYHFAADRPGVVVAGFTTHLDRGRPHWFWRECEGPIFTALQAAGATTIESFIRADRQDWVAALVANYGAANRGPVANGRYTRLEYDLADSLTRFTGFPPPRTAGPSWTFAQGAVVVREEANLSVVRALMTASWGADHPRLPDMLATLDERTALDQGTVLVGAVNGVDADAYVIRQRRPAMSSMSSLTQFRPAPNAGVTLKGVATWQQLVGYQQASVYVLDSRLQGGAAAAWTQWIQRNGFVAGSVDRTFMGLNHREYTQDLAAVLARPDAAWGQ